MQSKKSNSIDNRTASHITLFADFKTNTTHTLQRETQAKRLSRLPQARQAYIVASDSMRAVERFTARTMQFESIILLGKTSASEAWEVRDEQTGTIRGALYTVPAARWDKFLSERRISLVFHESLDGVSLDRPQAGAWTPAREFR